MKTRNFLLGAMGLFAMASCSNDEVISVNHDGDEITFSVATNSVSRAEKVYGSNNLPNQFYVSATYDGNIYINADDVRDVSDDDSGPKWENKSGTRYWPNTGDVTFFAYHNANPNDFIWNATNATQPPTVNFTVDETVANQKDFIYAKETQDKPALGGNVSLNFRHALSQIVFKAKNTNPNLYVEIYGVSVCKVKGGTATFTYPTGDTSTGGSWNLDGTTVQKYTATFSKVDLKGDKNATTATPLTDNDNNAMLLLPQPTTTAWDPAKGNPDNVDGTYFLVNCKIYNVKDPSEESINVENEVCLWGEKKTTTGDEPTTYEAKDIAIPINLTWDQGKKYIYTFVFGEGDGGYNPTQPDKPILVPITFEVSVENFVSGEDGDKEIPINPINPINPTT